MAPCLLFNWVLSPELGSNLLGKYNYHAHTYTNTLIHKHIKAHSLAFAHACTYIHIH